MPFLLTRVEAVDLETLTVPKGATLVPHKGVIIPDEDARHLFAELTELDEMVLDTLRDLEGATEKWDLDAQTVHQSEHRLYDRWLGYLLNAGLRRE